MAGNWFRLFRSPRAPSRIPSRSANPLRGRFWPGVEVLEDRLTPSNFVGNPALFQVQPEAPVLSRLDLFNASPVPALSNWSAVNASDSRLDPTTNGDHTDIYVIVHGWAPGFETMVVDNSTPGDPLKWWQTLDTSLAGSPGAPASSEMFYGAAGDDIQVSPSGLAYAITQADPKAVVLAYSWIDDSATANYLGAIPTDAYLSEAYTALNGTRLADALEQALPSTFHADGGMLHLIGHSHGSKVATVAADVLTETANSNFAVAQLTLLDSPEDSSFLVRQIDAANNLWYFLGALNIGRSSGQTFVDNYISEFDNPIGPIQGVNPFDTSQTTDVLQNIVDVNLDGGVLYTALNDPVNFLGDLHGYSFNWYAGASLAWAQNPTSTVADQWSPLINPSIPATLAGSYTQSWTSATQPQFALTPGPSTNTVTQTPVFTNLALSNTMTSGSSYDPATGAVSLTENGSSTATFTGTFTPESNLGGISFNYQFSNVGAGDQLVISVDTGGIYPFFKQQIHYVMTGTVAGTNAGFGTLSLTSLAGSWFNHTIQIELIPASGSSGASVTITNMQQFTTGLSSLGAAPLGSFNNLGGFVSQITSARDLNGDIELFGIGSDGALWVNAQTSPDGPYGGWTSLGGFVKQIAVGTNADGTLQVFGIGSDNAAWFRKQNSPADLTFGNWTSLGGYVKQLAVALDLQGELELFGIGSDNAVWLNVQGGSGPTGFQNWNSLGGYVTQITVSNNADGTIEVFGIGSDNAAWFRKQNSPADLTFGDWTSLGGYVKQLAVGMDLHGELELFGIGADNAVWLIVQGGSGPTDFLNWSSLGGFVTQIAVGQHADGTLQVFGIGSDNAAWFREQNSPTDLSFGVWTSLGGYVQQLTAGLDSDLALALFAIGGNHAAFLAVEG